MSLGTSLAAASMAAATSMGTPVSPIAVQADFRAVDSTPSRGAVTYDESAVPAGSHAWVRQSPWGKDGTKVKLRVSGLQADRTFGSHVHTKPCGENPDDSGPHFQHIPDPNQPSSDPDYANPDNEVWLDLATDSHGRGKAVATVNWQLRKGEARSVVIHAHKTHTGEGEAGEAGDRLACINVPFSGQR